MNHLSKSILIILALVVACPMPPSDAARKSRKRRTEMSENDRIEYRANNMINQGLDLLKARQEERGLKLLQDSARLFPKSQARFVAYLALGNHYINKRNFPMAIKQFALVNDSEIEKQRAETLYSIGICYYNINQYDRAFVSLRKVVNLYPATVFANESYYYIGLCHFKLGRWARSVAALKKVGTSTGAQTNEVQYAESGQRYFAKIFDNDLVVLLGGDISPDIIATTIGGDEEKIPMKILGKDGTRYVGSLPTALGLPVKGDGVIQLKGGEEISIRYVDVNTKGGTRNQKVLSKTKMVSTASIGFTDGAYREYANGIFAEQPCFMRVKDLDGDTSDQADTLSVELYCQYKPKKEVDVEKSGVDLDDEIDYVKRTVITLDLKESGAHTGIFTGSLPVLLVEEGDEIPTGVDALYAKSGDQAVLSYKDRLHIDGTETRDVLYTARILTGQVQDVDITVNIVANAELKAHKNLIEARLQLRLGEVFKEVGLDEKASQKAEVGVEKANEVIKIGIKSGINRSLIEDAYNVKWDLLIVQDKLREAIAVCNQLVRLFPDSTLVDAALMKIGIAKSSSKDPNTLREAIQIFSSVIRLPKSTLKSEAQFRIAELKEKSAIANAKKVQKKPALANVMLSYKKVADNYPESNYAGRSLDKIVNYYIKAKDYTRAISLMEQVFQDYPDASFLDGMLYKWAVSSYRIKEYKTALSKIDELLSDYPESKYATKARKIHKVVSRKI